MTALKMTALARHPYFDLSVLRFSPPTDKDPLLKLQNIPLTGHQLLVPLLTEIS